MEWILSEAGEDIVFFILRASEPSMVFSEISSASISRDGLSFSFIDKGCEPGMVYHYRVDVLDGNERKVFFEAGPINTPAMALMLLQNHPNPFNPSTVIRYYLPESCHIAVDVYNVDGTFITGLDRGYRGKGYHTIVWNGRDRSGHQVSSGVYFYRLKAGKTEISRKMVLARCVLD